MKASVLIKLLSEYPDYEVKVLCDNGISIETSDQFSVDIVEHLQRIYLV